MIRVYSETDVRLDPETSIYVANDGLYVSAALFDTFREYDATTATTVMAILNLDKTIAVADVSCVAGSVNNVVIGTFSAISCAALAEGYYYVRVRCTVGGIPSTFKLAKIKILKVP